MQAELKNRNSILTFLLFVAESNNNKNTSIEMKLGPLSNDLNNKQMPNNNFKVRGTFLASSKEISCGESSTLVDGKFKVGKYRKNKENSTVLASSTTTMTTATSVIPTIESNDVMEELVQDAIYSFTGIQGKYLRKNISSSGFRLDPNARKLNACHAGLLLRLSELGHYHDEVKTFTDKKSGRSPLGLLGQGLITSLQKELTQYYGMVALLQEQLNRERQNNFNVESFNQKEKLTLLKVMVWSTEPIHRLKWLATIIDSCQDKKGGALASAIYEFKKNGDPVVKSIVKELLIAVCGPLQFMLSKWLLEGEIEDPHSEFFIEALPDVCSERLWHDKYRVREGLLPNFISKQLAHRILVTGKSINYLREVCLDKTPIKGREELKQCFQSNVDNLFSSVSDTKLHLMIDNVYLSTSKKVLDIVMGPHKLLDHLQAMRKYLLLGQGDFIGLLMENLKYTYFVDFQAFFRD